MTNSPRSFFADGDVPGRILAVIRDAKKEVVLVSPYLGLWGHAKDYIRAAKDDRVDVRVILRMDEKELRESEDVRWLLEEDVSVSAVDDLHAKIYMNEHSVLLSSMNLTRGSTQKSRDFAIEVSDSPVEQAVRQYVSRMLEPVAHPVVLPGIGQKVRDFLERASRTYTGKCIRCSKAIELDESRPLCDEHYPQWAKYKNPDYAEKFCHSCGRSAAVTYAKPLCTTCYRKNR